MSSEYHTRGGFNDLDLPIAIEVTEDLAAQVASSACRNTAQASWAVSPSIKLPRSNTTGWRETQIGETWPRCLPRVRAVQEVERVGHRSDFSLAAHGGRSAIGKSKEARPRA